MNVKLNINEIIPLLGKGVSMEKLASQLQSKASEAGLLLPAPQAGAGYLQWTLPGAGWIPFSKAPESDKPALAQEHQRRCDILRSALEGSPAKDAIVQVPSEEYIFFRPAGATWEMALVAWGYRFPDSPGCKGLETWIVRKAVQDVCIAFLWDGEKLPNCPFKLNGFPRQTDASGMFIPDQQLYVGSDFTVQAAGVPAVKMVVEAGKRDYFLDLTAFFDARVQVNLDGAPLPGATCILTFGDSHIHLNTDAQGQAFCRQALIPDSQGIPLPQQPSCQVRYGEETQRLVPTRKDDVLTFIFDLHSPKKEEPPVPPVPPVPPMEEKPKEEDPEPEEEPGEICITLLDYGGYPLPDMPFFLKTKRGELELRTDANGCCMVSKALLTPKEKLSVRFTVTPDYQNQHDLHDTKS